MRGLNLLPSKFRSNGTLSGDSFLPYRKFLREISRPFFRSLFSLKSFVFSWLVIAMTLSTLYIVVYSSFYSLSYYNLSLIATYQPGYIEINSYIDGGPEQVHSLMGPGDRIVALDNIPLSQLLQNSDFANRAKAYNITPGFLKNSNLETGAPIESTPVAGQQLIMLSIKAGSLTIERANTTSQSVINTQSLVDSWLSPVSIVVSLDLISLCFCLCGFFLYFLKPTQTITFLFCVYCDCIAVAAVISTSNSYNNGLVERCILPISMSFLGVTFFHFVLLFPYNHRITSFFASIVLRISYLAYLILLPLWVYTSIDTYNSGSESSISLENVFRKYNTLFVMLFIVLSLIVLGFKFFKAKDQKRLRLTLAVFSICCSLVPTLIIGTGYSLFGWWYDLLNHYRAVAFVPSVLMPIFFSYSVIKNELLGIDLLFRWIVEYFISCFLIVMAYLSLTAVLTAQLHLGSSDNESIGLFTAIVVAVLLSVLNGVRSFIQKYLNRLFKIDSLDFVRLGHEWTQRLLKTDRLESLFANVIELLPADYHYREAAILLTSPKLLSSLEVTSDTFESSEYLPGLLITNAVANNSNSTDASDGAITVPGHAVIQYTSQDINPSILDTFLQHPYILVADKNLAVLQDGPFSGVEVALPFNLQGELYGAILLSRKSNDYIPTNDELMHLSRIANQIAVSLHNSLVLNEASKVAIEASRNARVQSELRQSLEKMVDYTEQVRELERKNIADDIHDGVIQSLVFLRRDMAQQLIDWQESQSILDLSTTQEAHELLVRQVIEKLRTLNFDLNPFPQGFFTKKLEHLIQHFQSQHPQLRFSYSITDSEDGEMVINDLMPVDLADNLLRIIREAFVNALKHAQASHIDVLIESVSVTAEIEQAAEIEYYPIVIRVRDNGIGLNKHDSYDFNSLLLNQHYGLSSMAHRLVKFEKHYGASLMFRPAFEQNQERSGLEIAISLNLPLGGPILDDTALESTLEQLQKQLNTSAV